MDRTPLTVFAPIDRSLHDLLAKSKSRSINLIELAKHHIGKSDADFDLSFSKIPISRRLIGIIFHSLSQTHRLVRLCVWVAWMYPSGDL